MMREINAIVTIAYRDWLKLLRDKMRLVFGFVFPLIFIGILGGSLQANLGSRLGFNFLTFVFTGVLAQTLFQNTASGIISLIEDRETDFSREIFVSPISRYSIIIGKIFGESLVALTNLLSVGILGVFLGVHFGVSEILWLIPISMGVCLFGGAFGLLVMTNLKSQRSANQVFPFIMFPQIFLSGAFSPIKVLPLPLFILSRVTPMTYAVDLLRGVYYWGKPEYAKVVLYGPAVDLVIIGVLFAIFLLTGTVLFVRGERNR